MKLTPTAALTRQAQSRPKSGGAMMRMTIAVGALIVVATTMLRSRSSSIELSTAAKPPSQELHSMVGVNNLPTEEIEDLSLFRYFGSLNF
jgi:hypothetical protein